MVETNSVFEARLDHALMRKFDLQIFKDSEFLKDDPHLIADLKDIVMTPQFHFGLVWAIRGMRKQLGLAPDNISLEDQLKH